MKIAIPAEEQSCKTPVCASFGRAPGYAFYETETKTWEYKVNDAAESPGGAGVKAAQFMVDSGAEAVVTFRCGRNAADILAAAGIEIYRAVDGTLHDNAEKFTNGELQPITEISPGRHGGPVA